MLGKKERNEVNVDKEKGKPKMLLIKKVNTRSLSNNAGRKREREKKHKKS